MNTSLIYDLLICDSDHVDVYSSGFKSLYMKFFIGNIGKQIKHFFFFTIFGFSILLHHDMNTITFGRPIYSTYALFLQIKFE